VDEETFNKLVGANLRV